MTANQSAPGLNRGLSSDFFLAEKYKPGEIYWWMCEVYGKAYFSQSHFYIWAKHRFASKNMIRKSGPRIEYK